MVESPVVVAIPRRRLCDNLITVSHQACDEGELETAATLLALAEDLIAKEEAQAGQVHHPSRELLVAAHLKLWNLRHPG